MIRTTVLANAATLIGAAALSTTASAGGYDYDYKSYGHKGYGDAKSCSARGPRARWRPSRCLSATFT